MKKLFRVFTAMMLAVLIAMSAVAPAFAQAEQGTQQRTSNYIYEYKYDENGRLMFRIWDDFKQMYITDWEYV